jgi:hypothetical protein
MRDILERLGQTPPGPKDLLSLLKMAERLPFSSDPGPLFTTG